MPTTSNHYMFEAVLCEKLQSFSSLLPAFESLPNASNGVDFLATASSEFTASACHHSGGLP